MPREVARVRQGAREDPRNHRTVATSDPALGRPFAWLALRTVRAWSAVRREPLVVAAIALTLWLVVIPLAQLVLGSFRSGTPWAPGPLSLDNYRTAYGSARTYTVFGNTLVIALASTALSLLFAGTLAYLIERTDLPRKNIAWALVVLPLGIPGLLYAIAWTMLMSPTIGMFNVALRGALGLVGVHLTEGPLNVYSLGGIVILEALRGVGTVFLILVGSFRAMDPALEEAAMTAGATPLRVLRRIFVPLLAPALLAAGVYNLMSSLESLEIPLIAGLPGGVLVFSSYIYFTAQGSSPPDYGLSAALGSTFLVVGALLLVGYRRATRRAERFATITGKGYRPTITRLGRWRYIAFAAFIVYFILTIGAPLFALVWRSLLQFYVPPSLEALSRLSLRNYEEALRLPKMIDAFRNSLVVVAGAATLTVGLSLVVAWVVVRIRSRATALLDGVAFLPHAVPGVIVAVALVFLYLQPPLSYLGLYGTVWLLVLGITVSYIAFGTRTLGAAVTQIHVELEEAASMAGASRLQTMRRVLLPLLAPALVAVWIWAAAHAVRAFSVPLILETRENIVLSVLLWDLWHEGRAGPATALAVLFVLLVAAIAVAGRVVLSRVSRVQRA